MDKGLTGGLMGRNMLESGVKVNNTERVFTFKWMVISVAGIWN